MFFDKTRKQRFRPFSVLAGIGCREYSIPLQKVITDFGADVPFNKINSKLKEHYGIEVPTDSARKITEHHGHEIKAMEKDFIKTTEAKAIIIGEIDGSMVPIVSYDEKPLDIKEKFDKRKHKTTYYREMRLSLAHEKGSATPVFAGVIGSTEEAGQKLYQCVKRVGYDKNTKVHCIGDGAAWIAEQINDQFGANGTYLIDLYHMCEYLSAAAPSCAKGNEKNWINEQKELLKQNQSQTILTNLKLYLESDTIEDKEAPVRACYRYINNRPNYLDYKGAIENGLPVGSGEIESAHRYISQNRLKIAGSWWKEDNCSDMLALRICRVNNGDWDAYWKKVS